MDVGNAGHKPLSLAAIQAIHSNVSTCIKFCDSQVKLPGCRCETIENSTFKLRLRENFQSRFCQSWWLGLLSCFMFLLFLLVSFLIIVPLSCATSSCIQTVCFCARSMSEGLLLSTVTQEDASVESFTFASSAQQAVHSRSDSDRNQMASWSSISSIQICERNEFTKKLQSFCAHLEGKLSSLALCPFLKSFGFHDNLQSQPGRIIVQLGMLLFWLLDALSCLNQVILLLVHVIHVPFK